MYKFSKALYGLKQAPCAWYSKIEGYFMREGFMRCESEHTLFVKMGEGNDIIIVGLYVDDLIFTSNNVTLIANFNFKLSMKEEFDMTDLGEMKYFLGVEVVQPQEGIFITQKRYAEELLRKFNLQESNPVKNPIVPGTELSKQGEGAAADEYTYRQLIGSLRYITTTRPDLMYSVSLLSRYMTRPTEQHIKVAKRVFQYLKGTMKIAIFYKRDANGKLSAFTDSDYARDLDDRRSNSGYVFLQNEGAVAWASKKQSVVTLSTTEAEFIAAA